MHYRAIFEKYDGVRTLWDPTRRIFFSRYGGELRLPADLIESMPNILLDGELWCVHQVCHISYIIRFGRGNFSETSKITGKSLPSRIDWVNLKCICSACFNSIFKNLFDKEQLWCLIAQPKRCFMQWNVTYKIV